MTQTVDAPKDAQVVGGTTPLPWRVHEAYHEIIVDADGVEVADCDTVIGDGGKRDFANAAFIVKAVNSHEALVEAVQELLATHPAAYRDPGPIDNRTDNAVKIARTTLSSLKEGK